MPGKRENIVFYHPSERPEQKETVKKYEKKHERERERQVHAVTPEETAKAVEEADRIRRSSRGVMAGEFKDKWLGKRGEEGVKDLADWTFTELFRIVSSSSSDIENTEILEKKLGGTYASDWKETVEPALKRLVKEVSEIGAQEHILHYFSEEWKPGHSDDDKKETEKVWKEMTRHQEMEAIKKTIWRIWDEYSNKPELLS